MLSSSKYRIASACKYKSHHAGAGSSAAVHNTGKRERCTRSPRTAPAAGAGNCGASCFTAAAGCCGAAAGGGSSCTTDLSSAALVCISCVWIQLQLDMLMSAAHILYICRLYL
jgi:hypothetical protein